MSAQITNFIHFGIFKGENYDPTKGFDNACRTTAFASIYNKAGSNTAKTKTQMCRFILAGKCCKFGARCSYAHSQSELKIQKCAFGKTCRTRYSKINPCRFDHTDEVEPIPAARPTLAQEVKSYWEEEERKIQEAVEQWKASQPKLEPFLIVFEPEEMISNTTYQTNKFEEKSDEYDQEMIEIMKLCNKPIMISKKDFNTKNLYEDGKPFPGVSSISVLIC